MPRKRARAYSTASREAARLLGQLIRLQRLERKVTAEDLADRAGITRTTLRKIEHGDLSCELGLAFEVAALVGVQLFGREPSRSEERRVGKACVSTCRSRWAPFH